MDRRIVWIVRNGALALALYFAMVEHVGWLMYAIGTFAWWTLARAAWAVSDPTSPPQPAPADAPLASALVFDLAVTRLEHVGVDCPEGTRTRCARAG